MLTEGSLVHRHRPVTRGGRRRPTPRAVLADRRAPASRSLVAGPAPPPDGATADPRRCGDRRTARRQPTAATRLTRATYDRLQAELEDLTTRGRVEIAQAIEAARALGDLSENGDYHAAKDAQGKMEARIRQLQALLKDAQVVEGDDGAGDGTVDTGTMVTLRYEGDDEDDAQEFFVGSIEERQGDLPVVSPSAPLGQALLGRCGRGHRASTKPRGAPCGSDRRGCAGERPRPHPRRQALGRPRRALAPTASPTCCSSTCTWSTRSPRPRPSTASAWPAGRCAAPT